MECLQRTPFYITYNAPYITHIRTTHPILASRIELFADLGKCLCAWVGASVSEWVRGWELVSVRVMVGVWERGGMKECGKREIEKERGREKTKDRRRERVCVSVYVLVSCWERRRERGAEREGKWKNERVCKYLSVYACVCGRVHVSLCAFARENRY